MNACEYARGVSVTDNIIISDAWIQIYNELEFAVNCEHSSKIAYN